MKETGVSFTGLRTGFRDLNEMTGGLQKTDLIIITGRPGMGKSSLGANIADRVYRYEKKAVVAVFSLEMSSEQYTERIICSKAEVDLMRYRRRHLTQQELENVLFKQ